MVNDVCGEETLLVPDFLEKADVGHGKNERWLTLLLSARPVRCNDVSECLTGD